MRACTLCKKLVVADQPLCPDDNSPTRAVSVEPLPEALAARFAEHEAFAAGETGTLYRVGGAAEPQVFKVFKVLKVVAAGLTRDAAQRTRYRRELHKQLSLSHPLLPRVLEEGETDERLWFVRDHVHGQSLSVRLKRSGAFPAEAAYRVMAELASALDGMHRQGLSHRDLKPGHVLFRAEARGRETLQVIDAALASPLYADRAEPRGTADYAAPEIIEGGPATLRSDLYALGCLSYELLTGAPPFRGASLEATLARQRSAALPDLDAVPEPLRALIASLLEKDARRRPFSAQQVRRAIEPALAAPTRGARRGARTSAQPRAAALRAGAAAAKPLTPAQSPEATIELDVDDLEHALAEPESASAPRASRAAELDSAPTIALSSAAPAPASPAPELVQETQAPQLEAAKGEREERVATAAQSASEAAPKRARTATQFGLGPVHPQDLSAALAQVATAVAPVPPAAAESQPPNPTPRPAESATRSAYMPVRQATAATEAAADTTVAAAQRAPQPLEPRRPLSQRPSLLLWASGALAVGLLALRLVLGPAGAEQGSRSDSVVVRVPEAIEPPMAALPDNSELPERSLIGGDRTARRPQSSASSDALAWPAAEAQPAAASESQLSAATAAQTEAEAAGADEEPADLPAVRTVSAAQVGRGLTAHAPAAVASSDAATDYKSVARKLYQERRYRDAAAAYQRATQLDGSDAGAFAGLGASLLAAGDARRAIAAYERAAALQPEVSGFRAALGRAYMVKGDRARARAAYAKALELDPKNEAARGGLAKLAASGRSASGRARARAR